MDLQSRFITGGEFYEVKFCLHHVDSMWHWCLGRVLTIRDAGTCAVQRWFGTCTDIQELVDARAMLARSRDELEQRVAERTAELSHALQELRAEMLEREQAEAALHQAQKMEAVGQLTGGIAHNLNNLLQGISGSLDLLQLRIGQGRAAEAERFVASATAGVQRAASLTQRLLTFSRNQVLDPKQVDANRLVTGIEDLVRRTVGPAIEVVVVLPGELWPTVCDAHQLENAMLNLAINARDAMPNGGRLTIETANSHLDDAYARTQGDGLEPGQYVSLSVTDTGTGMPAEVIRRAFEPFFTTKPIGQGTGLGLSMLYGFAKQSKGHALIYSEADRGTTVRLYLPRDRRNKLALDAGTIGQADPDRADLDNKKLLVGPVTAELCNLVA